MVPLCKPKGRPGLGKTSARFRKGREGDRRGGEMARRERRSRRKGRKKEASRAATLGGSDFTAYEISSWAARQRHGQGRFRAERSLRIRVGLLCTSPQRRHGEECGVRVPPDSEPSDGFQSSSARRICNCCTLLVKAAELTYVKVLLHRTRGYRHQPLRS